MQDIIQELTCIYLILNTHSSTDIYGYAPLFSPWYWQRVEGGTSLELVFEPQEWHSGWCVAYSAFVCGMHQYCPITEQEQKSTNTQFQWVNSVEMQKNIWLNAISIHSKQCVQNVSLPVQRGRLNRRGGGLFWSEEQRWRIGLLAGCQSLLAEHGTLT